MKPSKISKAPAARHDRRPLGKRPDAYLHGAITKPVAPKSKNRPAGKSDPLAEWDPKHFRLFVGNLGSDANDQLLESAFRKYPSMSKVKVPMDARLGKNKGYGFVAFASADDYLQAFKEMNGKYIGLHPVQLKRAETKIKRR